MCTVWKKQIEAGILLYALFMAAIFSLLLQFYLNRQVVGQDHLALKQEETKAYSIAILTYEGAVKEKDETGHYAFNCGKSQYQIEKNQMTIQVQVEKGATYSYSFPLKKESVAIQEKDLKQDNAVETKNQHGQKS